MKLTCGLTLTLPMLLLVLLLAVATKGHTILQCYSCDNCEKVDKTTPLEKCGGENLSMTTTTMSPKESTTMSSTTTTTTTARTSTPMSHTDSTEKPSTEVPVTTTTTNSTIELTTPSTNDSAYSIIGQQSSTSERVALPDATSSTTRSPPSVFEIPNEDDFNTPADFGILPVNASFQIPSGNSSDAFFSGGLNRQRRHTEFNGITYHCYKIQKKYDNVFGTKRGCIGIKSELSVCDELKTANNNQTKKCSLCETTLCNGSSTMGVSIAALLVVLFAVIFKV